MSEDSNSLIIDFSEKHIYACFKDDLVQTSILSQEFFDEPKSKSPELYEELKEKFFVEPKDAVISIGINHLNHQIVTVPDNVSDKEKAIFLGLELNKQIIGKKFGVIPLEITRREEFDQELVDYMLLSVKGTSLKALEIFEQESKIKIHKIHPSFFLLRPEPSNSLKVCAWIGEDRSEVSIWGSDQPLAVASIPETGDQIGDINRFIVQYFDHVDNVSLSIVNLCGPKMKDSALGFGLTYPHLILPDPVNYIARSIHKVESAPDLYQEIKLPKPPIPMTPRNLTFIACSIVFLALLGWTGFNYYEADQLEAQLAIVKIKSGNYKKLSNKYNKLNKNLKELKVEKDFYLDITKRRTPWERILSDVSKLTPKELWFERLSGGRNRLNISGKAGTNDDVSDFSINLNNNSEFIKEALILGTRDYEEDGRKYSEFQISANLKSPTGKYASISN